MKRILLVLIVVCAIFNSKAQQNVLSSDLLGITALPAISNTVGLEKKAYYLNLQYERVFNMGNALIFSIGHGNYAISETNIGSTTTTEVLKSTNLTVEYRKYTTRKKDAPFGFFSGVFLRHDFLKNKFYQNNVNIGNRNGGLTSLAGKIGWKIGSKVTFEHAYSLGFSKVSGNHEELQKNNNLLPYLGIHLALGYAF